LTPFIYNILNIEESIGSQKEARSRQESVNFGGDLGADEFSGIPAGTPGNRINREMVHLRKQIKSLPGFKKGGADPSEIEGFIQLPSLPARAGFPPNRILFCIAGKIPYSFLGGLPPQGDRVGDLERKFFPHGRGQILCFPFVKHKPRLG
jgi:hypothetical protein